MSVLLDITPLQVIFEERNNVEIKLGGESDFPLELLIENPSNPFTHRVHLTVRRK